MKLSETIKTELKECCQRIAEILGIKQGPVGFHCHHGKVKIVKGSDNKTVKFEESK